MKKNAPPKGMPWSAPVLIRKDGKKLAVELPPQVAADLKAGPGDVLNFTKLPTGRSRSGW